MSVYSPATLATLITLSPRVNFMASPAGGSSDVCTILVSGIVLYRLFSNNFYVRPSPKNLLPDRLKNIVPVRFQRKHKVPSPLPCVEKPRDDETSGGIGTVLSKRSSFIFPRS